MNGEFVFSGLRPGIYTLTESQPDGYSDGIDRNGYPAGTVGQDAIGAIAIAIPGTYASDYRFGERQNGLTGYVYNDATGDGVPAGL